MVGFHELVILIRQYLQLALQRVVVYLHLLILPGQLLEVGEERLLHLLRVIHFELKLLPLSQRNLVLQFECIVGFCELTVAVDEFLCPQLLFVQKGSKLRYFPSM